MRQFTQANSMRAKRGFTLVELLVVIAIIGTLVALLLPAVQSARESARNNTCKNRMKQMSLGMTLYDSSQRKLPGYVNPLENTTDRSQGRRASWVVMLFPYLEQGALWDRWSKDFYTGSIPEIWRQVPSANAADIEILRCPSDPIEGEGLPYLSYVVNAGQAFGDTTRPSPANSVVGEIFEEDEGKAESAANGIFFDLAQNTSYLPSGAADGRESGPKLQSSMDYIQSNDGTSRTLMVSENIHAVYWAYDELDDSALKDRKHMFGFVWHNTVPANQVQIRRINGALDELTPESSAALNAAEQLGYPNSQHPGGVNVAFAGGNVTYMAETVDGTIYAQLMTSNHKRSKLFREVGSQDVPDRKLPQPSDADF